MNGIVRRSVFAIVLSAMAVVGLIAPIAGFAHPGGGGDVGSSGPAQGSSPDRSWSPPPSSPSNSYDSSGSTRASGSSSSDSSSSGGSSSDSSSGASSASNSNSTSPGGSSSGRSDWWHGFVRGVDRALGISHSDGKSRAQTLSAAASSAHVDAPALAQPGETTIGPDARYSLSASNFYRAAHPAEVVVTKPIVPPSLNAYGWGRPVPGLLQAAYEENSSHPSNLAAPASYSSVTDTRAYSIAGSLAIIRSPAVIVDRAALGVAAPNAAIFRGFGMPGIVFFGSPAIFEPLGIIVVADQDDTSQGSSGTGAAKQPASQNGASSQSTGSASQHQAPIARPELSSASAGTTGEDWPTLKHGPPGRSGIDQPRKGPVLGRKPVTIAGPVASKKPTRAARKRFAHRGASLVLYSQIVFLFFRPGESETSSLLTPPLGEQLGVVYWTATSDLAHGQRVRISCSSLMSGDRSLGLASAGLIDPGNSLVVHGSRTPSDGYGSVLVRVYGYLSAVPRTADLP